jgi:phosphopantothenoylcysteine decarboxylase/phosphopantothenate--cysteine ligase
VENAKTKLRKKNLDLIVLNEMSDQNSCFQSAKNKITVIDKFEHLTEYPMKEKSAIAKDIFDEILKRING